MANVSLQELAHKQQSTHLTRAHAQALKLLIDGQQKFRLTVKDALSYIELVKSELGPLQYNEFQHTMNQCKEKNCDVGATLSTICQLLQGHPELIQGFGMFLPPSFNLYLQTSGKVFFETLKKQNSLSSCIKSEKDDCEIISQHHKVEEDISGKEDEKKIYEASDITSNNNSCCLKKGMMGPKEIDGSYAVVFLNKVKERFQHQPYIFEKFLQLLASVKKEYTGTQTVVEKDVFAQISELFRNEDDLIQEFKTFVPNVDYKHVSKNLVDYDAEATNPCDLLKDDVLDFCDPVSTFVKYSYMNDPSIASVCKYGSFEEHGFFDKVRNSLGPTEVYSLQLAPHSSHSSHTT